MAGKLCNSNTPKRQLDTEKKSEEHAQGLAVEQSKAERKGDIAVIMKARRKDKGPSGIAFGNSETLHAKSGYHDPESNRCKAENRRENSSFFGLASPSLPMVVSNARQGASKVTTSRVSERSASLERMSIFRIA